MKKIIVNKVLSKDEKQSLVRFYDNGEHSINEIMGYVEDIVRKEVANTIANEIRANFEPEINCDSVGNKIFSQRLVILTEDEFYSLMNIINSSTDMGIRVRISNFIKKSSENESQEN